MNAPPLQAVLTLDAGAECWRTERELLRAVLKWLRAQGCLVLHLYGFFVSQSGWPDVIALCPAGRLLLVELKTAKGTLRPCQAEFMRRAAVLGHDVIVARSLGEVQAAFNALYETAAPLQGRKHGAA